MEKILEGGQRHVHTVEEPVEQEENEELVVVESDTVVDPWTVVVHLEDAGPADGAVVSTVRFDHSAPITVADRSCQV